MTDIKVKLTKEKEILISFQSFPIKQEAIGHSSYFWLPQERALEIAYEITDLIGAERLKKTVPERIKERMDKPGFVVDGVEK